MERIKKLTIYDVIMAVTKMDPADIPKNPFRAPGDDDKELTVKCKLIRTEVNPNTSYYHLPQLNKAILKEDCTEPGTYDYIYNSEIAFILTFIGIGTFVVGKSHMNFKE